MELREGALHSFYSAYIVLYIFVKALKRQIGDNTMADAGGISIGSSKPLPNKLNCCGS